MKRVIFIALLGLLVAVQGTAQTSRTFMKSFPVDGAASVALNLAGQTEITEWSNNYIRVEMTVSVDNVTESVFKSLVEAGRYNLVATLEAGQLVISCPKLKNKVTLSGKEVNEVLIYKVFVPQATPVSLKGGAENVDYSQATSSL